MRRVLHIIFFSLMFFASPDLLATQCVSTGSGDWDDGATWSCGSKPGCGDTITILAGHTVTVATQEDYSTCTDPTFIVVEGILDFSNGKKLTLPNGSGLVIEPGGSITGAGGGGSSNVIDIGTTSVWTSSDGDIVTPTVLGEPLILDVKSIATGNWSDVNSWDCTCVPDSLNNVTIDAAHTITLDADATSANFVINGSFNYSGAFMLDISQNFNNNGTYTAGQGGIKFDGGIAQSITGTVTTGTFKNITVAAGSSVTHTLASIVLTGNLLIESGSFNSGNVMTLRSDGNGTANIGDLTNGTFTGNVIAERMIPAGATNWRFLASGIAGQTVSDWNDDFITSGFLGSDFPTFGFTSIYTYDETFAGHKDSGYVAISSVAESLTPGKGFWVYSGDNSTGTAAFTIDMVGAINQGSTNLPVTFTNSGTMLNDGWNMVGNPYPCSIDWDAAGWTKTNIDDAIYIWDPNSAGYASYVGGVGNNGGSNVIASSQAFWVKTNAASPSLVASESVKSTSLTDPFKNSYAKHLIRMTISKIDSSFKDETTLSINPSAEKEFGSHWDALKIETFNPDAVSISSGSFDGEKLSINAFPGNQDIEIPIYVRVPSSGIYKFSIADIDGINEFACVHLRDESNGLETPLDGDYNFAKYSPTTLEPFHAYTLVLSANLSIEITEPTCAQVNDGTAVITSPGTSPFEFVFWPEEDSSNVISQSNSSNTTNYSGLAPGTYKIEVANNSICPERISEVVIPFVDSTIARFNSDVMEITLLDNYEFSFINESSNAQNYKWEFGEESISYEVDPTYYFSSPGEYEVILTAIKNDVCENKATKKVIVLDVPFEEMDVLEAHIFPNPTKTGSNTIVHFNRIVDIASIRVFDIAGKLVHNKSIQIESTQTTLNLNNLLAGVYMLDIQTDQESTSIKLIVK